LYKKIIQGKIKWESEAWSNVSPEAKLFVKACLTKIAFLRLTPKEGLFHPWIKGIKLNDSPLSKSPILRMLSPPLKEATFTQQMIFSPVPKRKSSKVLFSD